MTNEQIKNRIARHLTSSPVGLLRKTLIDRINVPGNIDYIIDDMIRHGHIDASGSRVKMSALGRAYYAEDGVVPAAVPEPPKQSATTGIESAQCFKTPDGQLFFSHAEAEKHLFLIEIKPKIERFMLETKTKKHQNGIIRKLISDYELWLRSAQ